MPVSQGAARVAHGSITDGRWHVECQLRDAKLLADRARTRPVSRRPWPRFHTYRAPARRFHANANANAAAAGCVADPDGHTVSGL